MALGKNILTIRESKGISIEDLARKCNVACSKLIDWEAGDSEPSITELKRISYILGVTIDELVKEKDIVPIDERHYLTDKDYNDIACMISCAQRDGDVKYMQGMDKALSLSYLLNFAQYAFMNEDGVVYDRFLVSNTDRKSRQDIIRKHFMMHEGEEKFKDYIEGKCEFNENFAIVQDDLHKMFNVESKKIGYITNCEEGRAIYSLNFICELTDLEDYSDKKINEIYKDIQDYIKERTGKTILDRLLIFWANEALETLESKNMEKINELAGAWKTVRDSLFMLIPDGKKDEY